MENSNVTIEIILAGKDDVQTLCRLGAETFNETFASDNSQEDMKNYNEQHFSPSVILQELSDSHSAFFIALANGKAAAYMKVNYLTAQTEAQGNDSLEIQRIYVLSAFKNLHIGSRLMKKAEEFAEEKGLHRIWLGVWEHNEAAKAFYDRKGYRAFDQHVFVLGNDVQTDLLLSKTLKL